MAPKKILCCTDFNNSSNIALNKARDLAILFGAELCLIHVLPKAAPTIGPNSVSRTGHDERIIRHNAKRRLYDALERHIPRGIKAHGIVRQGDTVKEIARAAKEEGVSLIVIASPVFLLSTRGRGDTTVSAIEEQSPCPVLAVIDPAAEMADLTGQVSFRV